MMDVITYPFWDKQSSEAMITQFQVMINGLNGSVQHIEAEKKISASLQATFLNYSSFMKITISYFKSLKWIPNNPVNKQSIGSDQWLGAQQAAFHWWSCLLMYVFVTQLWWINSLAPGKFQFNSGKFQSNSKKVIFKLSYWMVAEVSLMKFGLTWMPLDFTDDQVNTGSGNGLVPSGNKPLPEPMLT